jgi:hypothetical protein
VQVLHGVRHIRSLNDMFDEDHRLEVTMLLPLLRFFNFGERLVPSLLRLTQIVKLRSRVLGGIEKAPLGWQRGRFEVH